MKIEFTITRKKKGSRTFFIPMVNGVRLSNTNWARKYDAQSLIRQFRAAHTNERIAELLEQKAAA